MVAAAALVLASMAGALMPGRTFYHRDLGTIFHPLIAEARHGADGAVEMLPAWTHATASGRPILENPGYALLSPGSLLWLAFPHETAFDLYLILHAMIAAAGMAFLALRLGTSSVASLAAGACLGLGAGAVSAHSLYWSLVALAFAPWVIAAGIAACEAASPRRFALLALALGLQADGGMPEVVLATLLLGGILSLITTPGAPVRRTLRIAVTWGLSGIWGIALAAPQLVPAAMNAKRTLRGLGIPADIVLMNSLDPRALPGFFIPRWGGNPLRHLVPGAYPAGAWGDGGVPYLITSYCGLVFAALAIVGLVLSLRGGPPRRRALMLALAGVAAFGAVLALGGHVGPVRALVEALPAPPLRFPIKALFIPFLAAPLLAALGLDAVRERFHAFRAWRPLALAVVLLGALDLAWAHRGFMPTMSVEGLAQPPLVEVLRRRASELGVEDGQWYLHHHRSPRAEWSPPAGSLPPEDLAFHQWQRRMLFSPSGVPFGIRYALERQGDMLEDLCAFQLAREIHSLDPSGWARELGGLGTLFLVSFDGTLEQQTGGVLVLERPLGEDVGLPAGSGFLYRDTAFRPRLELEEGEGRIASWSDDHHGMTIRVEATTPVRLVVREIVGNRTCWRATAGERELPMERSGACFAAIPLPAGDTTIRLQRTPPSWRASLAACALGLLGVLVALTLGRRTDVAS